MLAEPNKVKVVIDEEVYVLSSHESVEHIQEVAAYIDNKIKEIYAIKSDASVNSRLKTLFISLNIADDLFKEKTENKEKKKHIEELDAKVDAYSSEIAKLEEENRLLKDSLKDLQIQLTNARNELEEYIEVFEVNEAVKNGKVTKMR